MDNTKDSPSPIVPILLPFSDPSSAAEWVAEFQAPSTEQELTLKLRSVEVADISHLNVSLLPCPSLTETTGHSSTVGTKM